MRCPGLSAPFRLRSWCGFSATAPRQSGRRSATCNSRWPSASVSWCWSCSCSCAIRATLIPSVTIPVSLLATCTVMYLVGYTIDNVSLMALTIAVGFIIDDAVVMVENIIRHIEAGERPLQAALIGSQEIGFTILSMTFSLIAVFLPLLLMGGLSGRLFREFAVTVSVAIVISGIVALTLTPMMCGWLLRAKDSHSKPGRIETSLDAAFTRSLDAYATCLHWTLRHRL